MSFGSARVAVRAGRKFLKPPPKLTLSEWADTYFYLSAESAAEPGRWKTLPYQKGILDAITDPSVEQISVKKSARVGYTKCLNAALGYFMHQDPCSVLVVQPTVDDAKGYSKEEVAPMIRDCPELARIVLEEAEESGPKDSGNTILHKRYPGGVLSMVGANSGAGFRRISRRVVAFDEVDAYPPSAGSDGDQIKLGIARTQTFWNRKILAGSTPLVEGRSRISALFDAGDQRRYFVPCPHCGHMAPLAFRETVAGDAHFMQWPEGKPEDAYFVCCLSGCIIEHQHKRGMVERGEWRAASEFHGHASFHIWAAYSYSPNASWGHIAQEFFGAKENNEQLKTFINTWLGETWRERGEAPDHERLYNRREKYQVATIPDGVMFMTAGVDVQKDRFVWEIVGWAPGKESWSIDCGVIPADTSNDDDWAKLNELLSRVYYTSEKLAVTVKTLAVDSGFRTQHAYNWARTHSMSRVIAVKGMRSSKTLLGSPSSVDIDHKGKKIARGYKVWPVGSDIAKEELYGWLKLGTPEDGTFPPGFCHFPEYGQDYFKQLTSEQLVTHTNKQGYEERVWEVIPGRENHWLDCRVYARAAAAMCGIDRLKKTVLPAASVPAVPSVTVIGASVPAPAAHVPRKTGFMQNGSDSRFRVDGKTGWFKK